MNKDIIYILNYGWENTNYGAILTAYALQKILSDYFKKECYIVDNSENIHNKITKKITFSHKFKEKYMKFTSHITSWTDYYNLNKTSNTFIVGSDQVFRPKIKREDDYEAYFLDFVDINAKKIAFSASFGVDQESYEKENTLYTIEKIKKLLNLFNYVSVREISGVKLAKDLFNINAECIIDPVFVLDKSYYVKLAKNSYMDFKNNIVSYILNDNQDYKVAKKYLSKKYNKNVIDLFNSNYEVETWLNAIRTCDIFLTDSFHGFCFSVIFNKPTIVVVNNAAGEARYKSVIKLLNLKNSYVFSPLEILKKDCISIYNDDKVTETIEFQRKKGLNYLKRVLESNMITDEKMYKLRIEYLEEKLLELSQNKKSTRNLKKILWERWLVIFYHLPKFMQENIRNIRQYVCGQK